MPSAHFRFYEELNDFLPPSKRKVGFEQAFAGQPAVKHMIDAQGVPQTEIDLILMSGESVDFCALLIDGAVPCSRRWTSGRYCVRFAPAGSCWMAKLRWPL